MISFWELFITFGRIGLFTFGGGYAMISIIEDICVSGKQWITHDEMMQMTVIAESTPGPIAVNCATYVGLKRGGILGAVFATVGVVLPSFVIILLISAFLDSFLKVALIANAFRGIKLAVGILILDAAVSMIRKMKKTPSAVLTVTASAVIMLAVDFFSLHFTSVTLMLLAACVSLCIYGIQKAIGGKENSKS